jgi:hypothetical protein
MGTCLQMREANNTNLERKENNEIFSKCHGCGA